MRRPPLHSLLIPAGILFLGCRDDPHQPNSPDRPSPAVLAAVRNSWTVKAPMPTPRFLHVAGVANNAAGRQTVYVFGGTDGEVDGFSTVEAYDAATDTWTTQPFALMPVDEVVSFNGVGRIGNKLYLPGGDIESGNGNIHIRLLQVYDPVRNTWTRKADMPRGSSSGVSGVIGGKLYVLTAIENFDEECPDCDPPRRLTRRLFRYDPATDTWTKLAWCPNFHISGVAGVIDGKLYVAGGGTDKLDIYDPARNRWSAGAPMPSARGGAGAAVLGAKLYVMGGSTPSGDITDEVLVYDARTNTWTTKAPLPNARRSLAATKILIGGQPHIVAVGGFEPFATDETAVYTP